MRTMPQPQHSKRRLTGITLIATAAFLLATQASFAQEAAQNVEQAPPGTAMQNGPNGQATDNADPPGRIARLNYTAGTVTTEPAGATDWSYAQINRPLTTGDQLWNDQNARSELHIGSTAVRLGPSTSLDILNLDDTSAQLKIAQGTLSARVRELAPGASYEIDTPNTALSLNGPGDYRVDVAPDGSSTTVTVRSGNITAYGDSGQIPVAAGQQIRFAGTNLQQAADNGVPGLDAFDQWAASRDAAEDRSVSARYVSRDIPGYQDLDANGTWRSSPQYGEVWVPRATPAGWAPYHDGHWVWQAPWGWTWVDDAPWGFAPYHYGRWAQVDDAWAWVPGPIVVNEPPVYAPALVAFVGGGGGGADWGVSLAIGGAIAAGVAWFPLGPGERWHPNWGGHDHWSSGYYNRVNNTTVVNNYHRNVTNVNVTNIHNTYINYHVRGGVTAVPATAFVHGQSVGRFAQKVDPQQWRNARINPGGPGIAPVKESFGPGLRNANYRPPASVMSRPVVATRSPAMPAAYHDGLAQRFAQNGGRVPGAGAPIVRTSVPARMAGGPGAMPVQNVRVVQSHMAGRTPGAAPGAPGMPNGMSQAGQRPGEVRGAPGMPNGMQQAGQRPGEVRGAPGMPNGMQQAGQRPGEVSANAQPQRGGEPQARPGMQPQIANPHQQPGEEGHPFNGVPRPPQANGANPNTYAPTHGAPGQTGQQAAEGRHEPAWTQPHTPMAQQAQQRGAPQEQQQRQAEARPQPEQSAQRQPEAQPQRPPEVRAQPEAPRQQPMQQAQQPRPEPRQQQVEQARPEPRPQQMQQPRPEPRPQQVQQPRPEPRPQQMQQSRPEPRPQQAQQPRPQPQHEEQRSGGGNHEEHHRG